MKEYREYRSPADWVEATARPYKAKYFELELMASASESEGYRGEATHLRQQAAILRRHIERLERLA
jgi:hypothetical protein